MSLFCCVRSFGARSSRAARAVALYGIAALAMLAGAAAPQAGYAQPALTLADAQRIAVERSQRLVASDASIAAAREMAAAVGQLPDPVLKLGIDNLPADGPDRFSLGTDFMTMRRIGVMQEFTRDDKRRLKTERYLRETDLAVTEKAATVAVIQRGTALAWLERFYLERTRSLVAAQAEEAGLEIAATEGAYRSGRGSQAEIFAARAARAALDDRLSEFDRRIRNARATLVRWVGAAADRPLTGEPALKSVRIDASTLDQELVRHPEMALLGRQVAVAEADAQLAKTNKQADWSLELAYQQRGPAYSNMVSLGVSIPLQWDQKNRQDRELGAKLALIERARAQQEDGLRAHIAEVRIMLNEWDNGHERLGRYERELIPLASERTQATLTAYRGGKSDLSAVLAARRNELEVRIQRVQLEMDTARVWAQLNFLAPDTTLDTRSGSGITELEAK